LKKPVEIPVETYLYKVKVVECPKSGLPFDIEDMDIFCVASNSFFAKGIRFVQNNLSTDRKSEYNHCGFLIKKPSDETIYTFEALSTVQKNIFLKYYEGKKALIARWNGMDDTKRDLCWEGIAKHFGQRYPILRIPLHAINLAHVFHWDRLVCSEIVAKGLFKCGARHNKYFGTNPDDISDEIHRELNKERTGPKYNILYEGRLPVLVYKYCKKCRTFYLVPLESTECPTCLNYISDIHVNYSPDKDLNEKIKRYNLDKYRFLEKVLQPYKDKR
jgi:hypothetical protein